MLGVPLRERRHDVAGTQRYSDCLGVITAVSLEASTFDIHRYWTHNERART
jgi:hypothetical protein